MSSGGEQWRERERTCKKPGDRQFFEILLLVYGQEILKEGEVCYKNWSSTDRLHSFACSFFSHYITMALRFALIASFCLAVAYAAHPWEPEARDANWMKHHEQLLNQTKNHGSEIQVIFFGE